MTCKRPTYDIEPAGAAALRRDGMGWMITPKGRVHGPCKPSLMDLIKGIRK